jgi:cytochrome c biogenesis protein CcdA/thiol-disulfide isomerase/thioredoxin
MPTNVLNLFLAFIEGFALILSPCILPILPILLAGSIEGGKKRPLGIILGFALVFSLFTLFSHFLVQATGINLNILRDISFVLLGLFGLVMLSNYWTEKLSTWTQKLANIGSNIKVLNTAQGGFWSGFFLGGLVSLIWTPCAGPILAAALVQIATQKTLVASFVTLLAFSLGSILPMIIIAVLGQKIIRSIGFLKKKTIILRKIFGAIIILTTLVLAYISHFKPEYFALLASQPSNPPEAKNISVTQFNNLTDKLNAHYPAPAIAGITAWIHSPPLNLQELRGKVILIDFWTYSCINCIRTLPYLLAWDKHYRDHGLVIIGVHTPEFEFEKNLENVKQAVARFGIQYPVALDNNYVTWQNYNNSYWPAHFLIDQNGQVVYTHFGEGDYDVTEHNIRILLGMNPKNSIAPQNYKISYAQTPETYFGYARAARFASPQNLKSDSISLYTFPAQLSQDQWALSGEWLVREQNIRAMKFNAAIKINFYASQVYLVMGSINNEPIKVQVLLNNKPIGVVTVTNQKLYEMASFATPTNGELTLIISQPGVELYTFTFG